MARLSGDESNFPGRKTTSVFSSLAVASIIYRGAIVISLFGFEVTAYTPYRDRDNEPGILHHYQRFRITPTDQTVGLGSSVTLPCMVDNKVGEVQWTKDGFGLGDLSGYERYSYSSLNKDNGDYSLVIDPVNIEDEGWYQCQVYPGPDPELNVILRSPVANLTVEVEPKLPIILFDRGSSRTPMEVSQILSVKQGAIVSLECQSWDGRPVPELAWLNSLGNEIRNGVTSVSHLNDTHSVASSTYIFQANNLSKGETFSCWSYSRWNEKLIYSFSRQITLHVGPLDTDAFWMNLPNNIHAKILWSVLAIIGILLILCFAAAVGDLLCRCKTRQELKRTTSHGTAAKATPDDTVRTGSIAAWDKLPKEPEFDLVHFDRSFQLYGKENKGISMNNESKVVCLDTFSRRSSHDSNCSSKRFKYGYSFSNPNCMDNDFSPYTEVEDTEV